MSRYHFPYTKSVFLLCIVCSMGAAEASSLESAFGEETAQRISQDPRYTQLGQSDPERGSLPIYVGSDGDCDHSDLQDAINAAADGGEVRLQSETFTGNFGISNKSLTLIGGFESCTATEPSAKSTLDGTGNGDNVVLDIYDNEDIGDSWLVELENLEITNGNESGSFDRGGGIHVEDDFWVTLTDVNVNNNSAETKGAESRLPGIPVRPSSSSEAP